MINPAPQPLAILYEFTTQPQRVTYAETDRMGFSYYANYLRWFEIGRVELLRSTGATYLQWEDNHGISLPVRHCEVWFKTPARYDDAFRIRTAIVALTPATIDFHYWVIRQEDSAALAQGTTRHAFMDAAGRIRRAGPDLLPVFFRPNDDLSDKTR
jgi:acyl-CoA thioester hydrolase